MALSLFYGPALTAVCNHHWEDHSLDYMDLCQQKSVNSLSRFVIAFLPRNNHLLISWLQSPSAVILKPKKTKSVTTSIFPPSISPAVIGADAMIFGEGNGNPLQYSCLENPRDGSLVGCRLWDHTKLDTTEVT